MSDTATAEAQETTPEKERRTVPVEVDLYPGGGKTRSIPFLWNELATVNEESCPFETIGYSMAQPYVFYLFRRDGGQMDTINVMPAIKAILHARSEEILAEARVEEVAETEG